MRGRGKMGESETICAIVIQELGYCPPFTIEGLDAFPGRAEWIAATIIASERGKDEQP